MPPKKKKTSGICDQTVTLTRDTTMCHGKGNLEKKNRATEILQFYTTKIHHERRSLFFLN